MALSTEPLKPVLDHILEEEAKFKENEVNWLWCKLYGIITQDDTILSQHDKANRLIFENPFVSHMSTLNKLQRYPPTFIECNGLWPNNLQCIEQLINSVCQDFAERISDLDENTQILVSKLLS